MDTLSSSIEQSIKDANLDDILDESTLPSGLSKQDLETFIGVLALPDDKFKIVAPIILEKTSTEVRKPEYVYETLKELKKTGSSIEELAQSKDDLLKSLRNIEELSQMKIDFVETIFDTTIEALYEVEGTNAPITIPIERLNDSAKIPVYAHETDAGLDVYALEDITIAPGETKLIPLGFKVAIPDGYEIQVRPKSGRCLKTKLRVANAPGTIDAGYRDEVGVIIDNIDQFIKYAKLDGSGSLTEIEFGSSYTIGKGEKFAQLVLAKVAQANFHEVEDVSIYGADRGGGFGSTGLK